MKRQAEAKGKGNLRGDPVVYAAAQVKKRGGISVRATAYDYAGRASPDGAYRLEHGQWVIGICL